MNADYRLIERVVPLTCAQCRDDERAGLCFYCENPLSKRHEHDHFPIPARAGGNHVVSVCYNCHDLKDRMPIIDWNATAALSAIIELWSVLEIDPREIERRPRLGLLRVVAHNLNLFETSKWLDLSTSGRIMFAKLAYLATADYRPTTDAERRARVRRIGRWLDPDNRRGYSEDGDYVSAANAHHV